MEAGRGPFGGSDAAGWPTSRSVPCGHDPLRSDGGAKPTGNALVEPFNGRLRNECLYANWFLSLAYVKSKIEA